MNLENKVECWLEEFQSQNTRKNYRRYLKQFHECSGEATSSDELKSKLIKWINNLKEHGKAPKTINTYVAGVISFYKDHGIKVPEEEWRKIRRRNILPPNREQVNDRGGTHEEWRTILNHMSIQGRSMYLFMLSTGARSGEARLLKESDLELEADPPRAHIKNEYTKGGRSGRTVFMTYEAAEAIKAWLREKGVPYIEEKNGTVRTRKKATPKTVVLPNKQKFAGEQDYREGYIWDVSHATKHKILKNALNKAGLNDKDQNGRWQIHPHSCRKFFRTNCNMIGDNGEKDTDTVFALMGWESYLDRSYLRTDLEKVAEMYKNSAIKSLNVFTKTESEVDELIKQARMYGFPDEKIAEVRKTLTSRAAIEGYDPQQILSEMFREHIKDMMSENEGQQAQDPQQQQQPQEESQPQQRQQKIVSEDELEDYLESGWEIEHVLNSKVVVAK